MTPDDLASLSATERLTRLTTLLRVVAQHDGYEALRQAFMAACYPTPGQPAAVPAWVDELTQPQAPNADDLATAEAYLASVRVRLQAKYGQEQ